MQEIADILKSQREASGLTLDEIFQRTRINPEYLKALETGRFDILPPTYVKLFLKTFAREVGLNPAEVIKRYEMMAPTSTNPSELTQARPQRAPAPILAIALTLIFIVAVIVVALQISKVSTEKTAVPLDATVAPQPKRIPPPVASVTPEIQQETQKADSQETAPTEQIPPTPAPQIETAQPVQEPIPNVQSDPIPAPNTATNLPLNTPPVLTLTQPVATTTPPPSMVTPRQVTPTPETTPATPELPTQETTKPPVQPVVTTQMEPETPPPNTPELEVLSTYEQPLTATIDPNAPFTISGLVSEATQLSVYADGKTLFSGEVQAGSQPRWQARDSFRIFIGRAGAVAFSLQNQALAPKSPPNRTLRLLVTRTQIRVEELAPPPTGR